MRDSCDTRFGRGGLVGDDGPAPGDCGRLGYEFCLAGEGNPPEDRELPNDEFPASSSCCGNDVFCEPFRKDNAAVVVGGEEG